MPHAKKLRLNLCQSGLLFPAISEELLQFIWQFGYYNRQSLQTESGEPLTVLSPGLLNRNQGPDFCNARIRIGNTVLAGTVEVHLRTSDWRRHRHADDPNYGNVVLHVVFDHDEPVNTVPVLRLSSRIATPLLQRYGQLMEGGPFVPCGGRVAETPALTLLAWKERLLVERLTRKATLVLQAYERSNRHWEETLWWLLARAMGGTVNADAFEAVAQSVPLRLVAKHKASIHQLEALLLGQAGLLNDTFDDPYPQLLQREYRFLQTKYALPPVLVPVQFLRMRPGSFPTVRLAQLAMLVHTASHLFSTLLETTSIQTIAPLFGVTANDFWHTHYRLGQASAHKPKTLGADTVQHILVNAVVPLLFAFGLHSGKEALKDRALQWLQQLPPEANRITAGFTALGLENRSAFDSQALLELKNRYCNEKRCLACAVGANLLREAAPAYGNAST